MATTLPKPPPPSWKGVLKHFEGIDADVRGFLPHYAALLSTFPWDVCLGYLFTKIEQVHRRTVYCGVVKLHQVDADMAWAAVDAWEMYRAEFRNMFQAVFEDRLPKLLTDALEAGEQVRDKVLHGATVSDPEHRHAAVRTLDYANEFHTFVKVAAGFPPFGDLRGFKGRAPSLPKNTSRLVLKGLGFKLS